MKLTDELKNKLENAKSEDEAKTILSEVQKGAAAAGPEIEEIKLFFAVIKSVV